MILNWPQITLIVIYLIGLGVDMERNGQPKTGNHSLGISLIAVCINLFLLYSGGFFG